MYALRFPLASYCSFHPRPGDLCLIDGRGELSLKPQQATGMSKLSKILSKRYVSLNNEIGYLIRCFVSGSTPGLLQLFLSECFVVGNSLSTMKIKWSRLAKK